MRYFWKYVFSLIAIICLLPFGYAIKVSFYGASHIAMPQQASNLSTNIRLRFRTQQSSSIIFLAAGRTDYCLLSLDDGRIKLIYKINDHQSELWSPKNLHFNDLEWHEVAISRYETNITMQVDKNFIRKNLSQSIGELNVNFGVFIGGLGDFSDSYLDSVVNYRGCISDVFFNSINVFKRARERTHHASSMKVSWNCAAEFDAGLQESISFIEDDAYMMLTKPVQPIGETWSLELRTTETLGGVLYNPGINQPSDFLALEIVDSRLRLLVGKGANAVELIPDRNVSDGRWHNVSISYSPQVVEIFVDDLSNQASFANGSSPTVEFDDEFFIGGIDVVRRRRAMLKGIRSSDISFRGCMRNIFSDRQQIGFPTMKVTQGVTVDCVWKYPCIEKTPCIISGLCQQYGIDEFICHCDQAYCIKAEYTEKYKIFSRSGSPIEAELLGIAPLQLLEGDSIFLSSAFIDVLFDYKKVGITESGILFHVAQPPKFGRVAISSTSHYPGDSNVTQSKYFSLVDLSTDKVKYIHHGGEHFTDHMAIDLQMVAKPGENIPSVLHGRHRFVLHVNITPVNDPPMLVIPSNRILRLTQGIPKVIENDLLNADDPDSPPTSLIYTVSPPTGEKYGKFEISGKSVTTFSQNDINLGSVTYTVNTPTGEDISYEIMIQVSDGMETSPSVVLKVSVVPLQLRMINNTGLILVHRSSVQMTPWNLSFISNSEDENVDVQFDIVQPPQYGVMQKLRSVDASWIGIETFSSSQIALGQIRYLHTNDLPIYDEFKFTATLGPIKSAKYDFRLTFTKLSIGIQIQNVMEINGIKEVIISCDYLLHQTTPLMTYTKNIIYTVVSPPKYGVIFVEGHPEFAEPKDTFTQNDIDKNLIRFRTYLQSYSKFTDIFQFTVSVPECETVEGQLVINYTPSDNLLHQLIKQTHERISVQEGGRTLLTRKHFDVLFNHFNSLTFRVAEQPLHGALCNYDPNNARNYNIEHFTLENLYLHDIHYCHDDSESTLDRFNLVILSDRDKDFQYVSEIGIDIILQNDNGPYRVFEKIFHIVREENKVMSGFDLKYSDPDLNTTANEIIYTNVTLPNGEFMKSGLYVNSFSQDDLNNRRVLLKHNGPDFSRAVFIVTDGLYEVPGVLEIQASDPFLKIRENNASVVQEGKMVVIKQDDLSVETNLNSKPDEIEYKITDGPHFGQLHVLRNNGTTLSRTGTPNGSAAVRSFTQLDIDMDRLAYLNTDVASMDKIKYRVATRGIWTEGEILIRIYPSAYWEPLQVHRNQTLFVEESTSVNISRHVLEIIHPSISPGDITYLVTTSPQHGYLEIQSITSDDEYNCKVFDQSTVNSGKMFYIQAGVNQSTDYFIFDVTNGITWLRDLMMKIVIIPENIYMRTRMVIVEEGKNILVEPDDIMPISEFYLNKIVEYKILTQPAFGQIRSGKSKVNRFTQKQLEAGVVYYVHDGSENSSDSAQLIAVTRTKESLPFDLMFSILPVNDEVPMIVTNTGLHMWIGGKSVIKKTDLMAQDYDTGPDDLRFIIKQVRGGYIAFRDHFKEKINNFTQTHINEEQIIFVHDSNQVNGKIRFYVSDDIHNSSEQVLYITTNPVVLEQVKNQNLHVFPMTRKTITNDQLHFRCSDLERDVKYVITIPPQMGRILYEYTESGMTIEVNEFIQSDVDAGRILYEHIHPMAELKSNDSFYFNVAAFLANSLIDQIFYIDISVSSGGLLRFLPVPRLTLDEGESSPIRLDLSKVLEYLETRAGILSPELYIESYSPQYGQVELLDSNKKEHTKRFTLNDFNAGKVIYKHDHSDTSEDKISMSVYLLPGQIFLCNITIPVIITPVNDQPFHLITQFPSIAVVEGENKTITRMDLYTEDADTSPRDLIYDIISSPMSGTLLKKGDDGTPQDVITYGNQFTQKDVNENRIIFSHSGNPISTSFYFQVTDGKFKPAYQVFNITIVPISIAPDIQTEPVYVHQGSSPSTAIIETKHIAINTNVHRNRLMFNVTRTPMNGMILLRNYPTLRFSNDDLENEDVSYVQSTFNSSNDTFQLNAHIPGTQYNTVVDVNIMVEPFITINPISILSGEKIRLSSTFLYDPSKLKLTHYNPKFTIIRKPRYGKFKKIIRNSGEIITENIRQEITSFTYKELKSGVVYFFAKKISMDFNTINDSFEYMLTMTDVQPGQKVVPIEIYSQNKKFTYTNGDINVIPADTSKLPFDFLLIAIIVISILLIFAILFIVIKCIRSTKSKNKNSNVDKNQPPILPRPDLMTMNNNRMYTPSEIDSIPATASSTPLPILSNIPHCKVYPIGLDVDPDSETDDMMGELNLEGSHNMGGRYPYGEDSEDWSSMGDVGNDMMGGYSNMMQSQQHQPQQPRTNPLLRRNQYWV